MTNAIKKIKEKINNKNITKIILIFLLLQPLFDILSFLDIRNIIPFGISTYVKPLVVFGVGAIIYLIDKDARKKWTILYVLYGILLIGHLFILNRISTDFAIILHELRFMINIGYMLVLYIIFDYMYVRNDDKENFIKQLKGTLVITFIIYCATIILAIITGTSGRTYEYSDDLKEGFKGWLDSGQIFGHALTVVLPFMMYYILNYKTDNKIKQYIIKLSILAPILILCLIGTKVTLFMCIIIVFSYIILSIFFAIKDKEKSHIINIVICGLTLGTIILAYPNLPTPKNMNLQQAVDDDYAHMNREEVDWEKRYAELNVDKINPGSVKYDARTLYNSYNIYATQKLKEGYVNGTILPSDNRTKQYVYNYNKFKIASLEYKIFGLGYLNQPSTLVIERDILMSIFNFGILGFLIIFALPILLWLKSTYLILRNIKRLNFETLVLYEGFSIFFCISYLAGYTFIYTNFSIFLIPLMLLLNCSLLKIFKKTL